MTIAKGLTDFRMTLRAQATIVYGISLRAPKSTPQRELDISANNVLPRSQMAGGATRDALWLTFHPNATLDEREEALEAVDGTVVGGSILGAPNRYYVRIPAPSKSNEQPLIHAIRTLKAFPQVRFAGLDLHSDINAQYLRPTDQGDFASWTVDPAKAAKDNWGEEAVSGPLAWGCSTGNPALPVLAIVDDNLFKPSDLAPNLAANGESISGDTLQHGTWVASIAAAVGNNNLGMTGMLWNTVLGFFNIHLPVTGQPASADPYLAIERAGVAGYPVLNLSEGFGWYADSGHKPDTLASGDSIVVQTISSQFELAIDSIRSSGHYPLFVISAGNDSGLNAYWSGLPAAKLDSNYALEMLVVASNDKKASAKGTVSSFSDVGPLVDLAAPGNHVATLTKANKVVTDQKGTSLASPFVSGTAGLLVSFDPQDLGSGSLTATDSLKSYIINGAIDGGRKAGIYPILNAYDALKRAAQLKGAPLCGNELWVDTSSNLIVQRTGSTTDTIGTSVYSIVDVEHGGQKVYIRGDTTTQGVSSFSYGTGGWSFTDVDSVAFDSLAGQYLSNYNMENTSAVANGVYLNCYCVLNHDGDSVLAINGNALLIGSATTPLSSLTTLGTITGNPTYTYWGGLALGSSTVYGESGYDFGSTLTTTVWAVPITGGTPTPILTYANAFVPNSKDWNGLSLSEDGSTLMVTYEVLTNNNEAYIYYTEIHSAAPPYTLLQTIVGNASTAISPSRVRRRPGPVALSRPRGSARS